MNESPHQRRGAKKYRICAAAVPQHGGHNDHAWLLARRGIGGPLAIWLIPLFGWRSLFVFGSAMSLAAVVVLALTLPESIKFLAIKGRRFDVIARVIRSIDRSSDLSPN